MSQENDSRDLVPGSDPPVPDADDEQASSAIPEILEQLPAEILAQLPAVFTFEASLHAGPLPSADEMEKYEAVLPGAADRIVKMAEGQADHRAELETEALRQEGQRSWTGLVSGALLTLGFEALALVAVLVDRPWFAVAFAAFPLPAILGAFVYGTRSRRREREQRARLMTGHDAS